MAVAARTSTSRHVMSPAPPVQGLLPPFALTCHAFLGPFRSSPPLYTKDISTGKKESRFLFYFITKVHANYLGVQYKSQTSPSLDKECAYVSCFTSNGLIIGLETANLFWRQFNYRFYRRTKPVFALNSPTKGFLVCFWFGLLFCEDIGWGC